MRGKPSKNQQVPNLPGNPAASKKARKDRQFVAVKGKEEVLPTVKPNVAETPEEHEIQTKPAAPPTTKVFVEPSVSESEEARRTAYVEKQVMPWLIEHLRVRTVCLQVFPAVQATIFAAYAYEHEHDPAIAWFGICVCLAFFLMDSRNRSVFRRLHGVARRLSEQYVLGVETDGVHGGAIQLIDEGYFKGSINGNQRGLGDRAYGALKGLGSHTMALLVMIAFALAAWCSMLIRYPSGSFIRHTPMSPPAPLRSDSISKTSQPPKYGAVR